MTWILRVTELYAVLLTCQRWRFAMDGRNGG
jgi:hypothetical protein